MPQAMFDIQDGDDLREIVRKIEATFPTSDQDFRICLPLEQKDHEADKPQYSLTVSQAEWDRICREVS